MKRSAADWRRENEARRARLAAARLRRAPSWWRELLAHVVSEGEAAERRAQEAL